MNSNQNQLYIYAVVALVIGLVIGYVAAGAIGGQTPTGDEELVAQIKELQGQIDEYESEIDDLEADLAAAQEEESISGDLFISGSSTVFPIADLAAEDFQNDNSGVNIQVEGPGSGTGVRKASDGTADIGMASRNVKPSELLNAPTLITFGVAKDSVSVVINPDNTLAGSLDLTTEQVNQIFTGEINNWSELGGENAEINVYSRESGSGTRATFMDFTGIEEGEFAADASIQQGNSAMRAAVAGDPNGIAYISLGYVDETVSPAKIDGAEGTVENVLAGTYPFQRILWMFTLGKPSELEQAYFDYVMSPEGQAIVEEEGFIPIYPTN
ncbi:phosphate ABC transporter substrate-binding protein PstS family protein [Candidatus Bathyarchaeota archaeon]|nr:phosphate ABC transporter substrate-binding protein PstS family protein [Candidatus Bathyarchaeota archaeon]